MRKLGVMVVAASGALAAGAASAQQGVTDTEIVLGTHTALSGPVAPWGAGSTNAIRLRFDEENAKGGIHGRKIRYIVEDHGYQVPRAVQAGNKLINKDRVFAMVAALGTPMNNAVFRRQLRKNVPNVGPFSAARSMVQPHHKLKFATLSTYYDQIRAGVKYFVEKKGKKAVCVMYQDTDFGKEILDATVDQLKALRMRAKATSGHKPTDTDFTGAISKMRKAGCDLVIMGTIIRDTIIPYATARKIGWNVDFLGSVATYDQIVAGAKGGITSGFYAMTSFKMMYPDNKNPEVKAFFEGYKKRFGKYPNGAAQLGYIGANVLVQALKNAGPKLTVDSFVRGMESIASYSSAIGETEVSYGPKKHQGTDRAFLAVVEKGRWKTMTGQLGYTN